MFFGWAVVQVSRSAFPVPPTNENMELWGELAVECEGADKALWNDLRKWISDNAESGFTWQLHEESIGFHTGMFQFMSGPSRASKSGAFGLLEWIAVNGSGSYGLMHVLDADDVKPTDSPGAERAQGFRVWRIFEGEVQEIEETAFNPLESKMAWGDEPIFLPK
jgi:hypothetical protein